MPFADLSQARIRYSLSGNASAPVLVFSNSLGTNFSMWDIQAAAFESCFHILRYDTRGHGQSSVPPGPYSIEQLANDVLELLDLLEVSRVHFCGLSMGGQIGQWLAITASQRLHKLIVCSSGAKIGNADGWNARIETVRAKGMPEVAAAGIARWFTFGFREQHPEIVQPVLQILESVNPEGYAACCAAVRDFDAREALSRVTTPTLVISGTHDPATPPADGRFLSAQITGARYVELNAAHLSNIEDSDRFNQEVGSFLAA